MKVLYIIRMGNIVALFVQVFLYSFLTFKLLRKHNKSVYNIFSNPEKYQLNWLKGFNIALALSSFACVMLYVVNPTDLFSDDRFLAYPLLIIAASIWYLGIMGNNQKNMAIEVEEGHTAEIDIIKPDFESKLSQYFTAEKPYLNPEFKITDVCLKLVTNRSYVSSFINDTYGKNFASYVNTFRVEEAKQMIKINPELSLADISEKAGFGSVASFNRAFLKVTGSTPTKFAKEI